MLRMFVCAAVALMLCAGAGLAQDKGKGKNTTVNGTIKKIDAATGALTVSVKGKKGEEAKDMEYKVNDTTKVTVYAPTTGEATKLTGKDALKNPEFKEGAKVRVVTDADNKVVSVQIGQAKKKDK